MKTIVALFIFLSSSTYALGQNKAAYLNALGQYYRCGNVTVTGDQLTVEALVKMDGTGYYMTGMSAFDIVSKHRGATDINYLLRPDHCELTTTDGYYYTTLTPSSFIKDSFYHMAMVYNGASLRFYVNGCLFSETPATGNVATNSYITTIGQLASDPGLIYNEQFFGYIDEVRIWQRARTDVELRENMQDLPSPSTQTGLLAYYKFEGNAVNIQGNAAFNAVPNGGATILNQPNFSKARPLHASFFIQSTCMSPKGSITAIGEGGISPVKYSINGGPYQTSGQFNDLIPGSYLVSVKGNGSGCVYDTTINITNAYVDLGPDKNICMGDSVLLDAGNSGAAYVWQDGSTDKFLKVRDSGTYSVQVTSGTCVSDDYVHIGFESSPSIKNSNDTSICKGSSLMFNQTADPSFTYHWTPSSFLSDVSIPNPVVTPLTTTNYILSVASAKGCYSFDTVTVTVNELPKLSISKDTLVCKGLPVQIMASGGNSYKWYPVDGLSDADIPDPVALPGNTIRYYVTVSDLNNCISTDSVLIQLKEKPALIDSYSEQICAGDSIILKGAPGLRNVWYPATNISDINSATPIVYPAQTTSYTVTLSDETCQIDTSIIIPVVVKDLPDVRISKSNDISCSQPTAHLVGTGAADYSWYPSNGIINQSSNSIDISIEKSTTYQLIGKGPNGCENVDTITVNVSPDGSFKAYVPGAFSPNHDGLNDCLSIARLGLLKELEFSIFNRWGERVFYTTAANSCWNGSFKGVDQPSGVFVYILKGRSSCGTINLKGQIILLR